MRLIDDDEKARAAAFRFPQDARRFVARRARLRDILAHHVGETAETLGFVRGRYGKPMLANGALHFSASQSHGLMMLAIADVEVGCDIEWIDPALEWAPIADRLFAPAERDGLRSLPDGEGRRGFFDCWSRKEAYVKAVGRGLTLPLDTFAVSVAREALLLAEGGWAIADAPPADHFSGAVVAYGDALCLDVRDRPSASAFVG